MKQYKVEKITKKEALDKVNKQISMEILTLSINYFVLFVSFGLTSVHIAYFFLTFPLAYIEGNTLDNLERLLNNKKRYLKDEFKSTELIDNNTHYEIIQEKGLKK